MITNVLIVNTIEEMQPMKISELTDKADYTVNYVSDFVCPPSAFVALLLFSKVRRGTVILTPHFINT